MRNKYIYNVGDKVRVRITDEFKPVGTIVNTPLNTSYCFVKIEGSKMKGYNICKYSELELIDDNR